MTPSEKFQQLLRQLFQFDSSDLDFGIYRIMNFKRDAIEDFVQKDLVEAVSQELSTGILASQGQATAELSDLANQISETLGPKALNGDGQLNEMFQETPLGQRYLELQARSGGAEARESLEALVFNHLYAFFSRYYDDGDFLSKRRYSRREKYAIPYNGEEVHLHWANADQYYIKTTEQFTDYRFKTAKGISVHFKLQVASVEKDNLKGDKRFFLPESEGTTFDPEAGEVLVAFEYRPLTEAEEIKYGKRNQQEAIIAGALGDIPARCEKHPQAQAALLDTHHRTADREAVSFLEHHLRRYARRNTSDYFIHKDLKGFLTRELDFYLKNEVLNLDELEAGGETRAEGWFQMLTVIRGVGLRIVEFLAQMEEFQKNLFEKKKFVTETQYCITVGNIDEAFYLEIANNEPQWAEWRELFAIDEEPKGELAFGKNQDERRAAFLKAHPTLVLDTKHFAPEFVDRLLGSFEDLDEMTDALLVNSENFQALNLFLEKYRERVKCIYIDPPYNTGKDDFLYKDRYQHSTWLAMLQDRVSSSFRLLKEDGVFFCSLDRNEFARALSLLPQVLPTSIGMGEIVWHNARDNNPTQVAIEHEYIVCMGKDSKVTSSPWKSPFSDAKDMLLGRYQEWKSQGLSAIQMQKELRTFIKDNKGLLGEVDRYKFVDEGGIYTGSESVHNPHPDGYDYEVLHPETAQPMRKPANGYRFPEDTLRRLADDGRLIYGPDENRIVKIKLYLEEYQDSLRSVIALDGRLGAYTIRDLFAQNETLFQNPKPTQLLQRLLGFIEEDDAVILDFFAGSGTTAHAVVALNRFSGRRWSSVLVEMGEYFDTVLVPRMKKVAFTSEWKAGKPVRKATEHEAMRTPRLMKCIRLESYEDSLDNIALSAEGDDLFSRFDDYLLKYLLDWETKDCPTLLNVQQLASPFEYSLTLTDGQETSTKVVDLPETFNFLLGLHVMQRQVLFDDDRRYLLVRGKVDHKTVVVIWRKTNDWEKEDFERDKAFVAEHRLTENADQIFVNGDSVVAGARSLDPVFKSRMFGGE